MNSNNIKEKIKRIAEKYNLRIVLIFGSLVSGRLHKESDIDVAFLPAGKITPKEEYLLNYELTNVFQSDRIDTVNLKKAPPLLLKEIIENYQLLYEAEPMIFDYFEAYVRQRYQEAKPIFKMHRQAVRRFVDLPA